MKIINFVFHSQLEKSAVHNAIISDLFSDEIINGNEIEIYDMKNRMGSLPYSNDDLREDIDMMSASDKVIIQFPVTSNIEVDMLLVDWLDAAIKSNMITDHLINVQLCFTVNKKGINSTYINDMLNNALKETMSKIRQIFTVSKDNFVVTADGITIAGKYEDINNWILDK